MLRQVNPAIRMTLMFTALTGIAYPLAMTGLCQWLFPSQANGSMVYRQGNLVGSRLIGQSFASAAYFHPRPSASGYNPLASGGSNLGPSNPALRARVSAAIAAFRRENPGDHGPIPADAVAASGSGLDPDISPAAAAAQVARVAAARHATVAAVLALIRQHTQPSQWGVLGDPRVNVLDLNLALDQFIPMHP